jgi:hypothetical protein
VTRDEAIAALRECPRCQRWRCVPECDHCWVDQHRCPPTLAEAVRVLNRAQAVGEEAVRLKGELKRLMKRVPAA